MNKTVIAILAALVIAAGVYTFTRHPAASTGPVGALTGWKWFQDKQDGFQLAYPPADFPFYSTTKTVSPLGDTKVTQVFQEKGPRGYLFVGIIDRPLDIAHVTDGGPLTGLVTVNLQLGKGARFTIGDNECGATVFQAPLKRRTVRVVFAACKEDKNRLDLDHALQDRVMSTLSLIK